MKLYTQDQVLKMLEVCRDTDLYEHILTFGDILKTETPIELPSDEEIEQIASDYRSTSEFCDIENFEDGSVFAIKWLRNKIQGGNNEQQ